jgi:NAD(P)-dependent dehydrogenase (short-subunit alcohol dehydrogenase family)
LHAQDDAVAQLVRKVKAEYGVPSIVVLSSARGGLLTIDEASVEDAMVAMNSTYLAAFRVVKGFVGDMLASGVQSHICVVGSPIRHTVPYFASTYVASRSALFGFAESLREDLHATNVHVSFCEPAFVPDSSYFSNNEGTRQRLPGARMLGVRAFHTTKAEVGRSVVQAIEAGGSLVSPIQVRVMALGWALFPYLVTKVLRREVFAEDEGGPPERRRASQPQPQPQSKKDD